MNQLRILLLSFMFITMAVTISYTAANMAAASSQQTTQG